MYYALLTIIVGVLLVMVSSLKYNEDIYDFLPMDENQQKAITLYQDITGGKLIIAMMKMKGDTETDLDRLSEAVDTFTVLLNDNDGVRHIKDITSQVDFEKIAGITDYAYNHLPFMLSDSDYVRMETILSDPEQVKGQLSAAVEMIMMPATGVFATNISYDPLGLFSPVMKRLQSQQAAMPFEMENGYIFTSDKRYAVVMMTSAYGSMESANNTLLVNYVDSIAQQTMSRLSDVDIAITGSPVIAVDNANQIKADSHLAIAIAVVLILALLVFSFRNAKHLMLIGVSILFGWLFAMAFIAVLRSNVSLIVLGIGSIIIGIAVNYPLHFIAHIAHGGNIRDVLKDMVSPLLIGNITTVGAFACLIPLDAPALRDLGLFAAFMLIGTILFVLVFLPHLVKQSKHTGEERLSFGFLSRLTLNAKYLTPLFWVIVLLTIFFGYHSLGTSFDANMHHINYLTPKQEQLMADLHISAGVNDSSNVYLVTEGNDWNQSLQQRRRLAPLLDSLKQARKIASFSDVTAFVSSEDVQAERIRKWEDFWSQHRDDVSRILRQQAPAYGFSDDAFDSFYEIISSQYTTLPPSSFLLQTSSFLSRSFSNSTNQHAVVDIVNVGSSDINEIEAILNEATADQGYSFDFVGMNSAVANALSDNFNYIGFACGFIVFLFLWLSFGRLELSILAFMPMAIGWVWILGIMNLLGMQFNIVNVILATFIFGQGDDYTIFMTDGLINEYAYRKKLLPSYKNSIIISALIMFIGMGALIVAKHPALHSLAEVTIVGMLTVVLMAWIIPPMIFNWLVKTNGQYRRNPVTIRHILRTAFCTVVYLGEVLYGVIVGLGVKLLTTFTKHSKAEHWFHRTINRIMVTNIHHIPDVKTTIHNQHEEDFSRGSIIISNHQSILDPVLMLALSPHVLILISDKVWKNPIVHFLFRLAGFIKLNQPMEKLKDEIEKAVNKGYNVVLFPEGKRNDRQITRFHKGAFYIAEEIGADILPVLIHGVSDVMPKGSGFASAGQIDLFVGKRIPAKVLRNYGDTHQAMARSFQTIFTERYKEICKEIETSHYFHDYVIHKYIYKGKAVERETRQLLKRHDDYSQWIDNPSSPTTYDHSGRGQLPLLVALVHPELEVHSYPDDPDDAALAQLPPPFLPPNLHIHPIVR